MQRQFRRSTFGFRQIGANVPKFLRPLDEAALSPRAFFISRRLVAEPINFTACQIRCLAPTCFAGLASNLCTTTEAAFHEPSDRHLARRRIVLFAAPSIQTLQNRRAQMHFDALGFLFHRLQPRCRVLL